MAATDTKDGHRCLQTSTQKAAKDGCNYDTEAAKDG